MDNQSDRGKNRRRRITNSERSTYQLLFVIIFMIFLYWTYWWVSFLFF